MAKKNFLKKTLAIALAATLVLGAAPLAGLCGISIPSLSASAADDLSDGDYTFTTESNTATVTGYTGNAESIEIPDTLIANNIKYSVVKIDSLKNCTTLKTVTLPESVKALGLEMFSGCINLETVNIKGRITDADGYSGLGTSKGPFTGSSVTTVNMAFANVPDYMFRDSSIVTVNMPETATSDDVIGQQSFTNCSFLTSFAVPEGIKEIETGAFYGCKKLNENNFKLNETVNTIGGNAFSKTAFSTFTVPESVNSLGLELFSGCINLETVNIKGRITDAGGYSGTGISSGVFTGSSVTTVNMAYANIPRYIFRDSSIETVNMPLTASSDDVIGQNAFVNCAYLKSFYIPTGITKIEPDVFAGCNNLKDAYYLGTEDEWNAIEGNDCFDESVTALHFMGIKIANSNSKIYVGDEISLSAEIAYENAEIVWFIGGEKVAEGKNYSFTADKAGKIEVKAACIKDGRILTFDTVTLTVQTRPVPTVSIKNNSGSKTINYGDILRLTANTTNMPSDARIFWYVDGVKMGEGTTFEVSPESGSVDVTVKVVDASGNDYAGADISASQKVTVKSGFLQKLINFFKNLFGISRIISQAFIIK